MAFKKLIIAFGILAFVFVGNQVATAKTFISIATGGTSGTYYPIGGAIAKATSTDEYRVTAETGNASVANVNLLANGEIEIAFIQNDIAYWAYNGQIMFEKPVKNLRAIAALYPEHLQIITQKDEKINGLEGLKGKRVGVGAIGSGTEADVRALFNVAGMTYKDIKVEYLDFGAVTNRLKDNQIDAGVVVAGYPTASIMDLSVSKDISLVSFDKSFLDKVVKDHPYFIVSSIPANTYKGVDYDVNTPAVMALLVTHEGVADDVIYEFTKNMFNNLNAIHNSHAKAKEINLETAFEGLTVPLHPGAAKFYKEKGLEIK